MRSHFEHMKPRAGIYTRVSTSNQKEWYSLPAQEQLLRDYARTTRTPESVQKYRQAGIPTPDERL